ncbi:MAG TPA: patatin-like phospholipase family protein [Solirubrobacteraceae bacterium]|nr:patatin-like phospholipase family protein [Solirubrobacteraceae bacterium]
MDPGAITEASFLAELPEDSQDRLRQQAEPVGLKMGEWLFHEGEPAEHAFVVRSGRLDVVSEGRIIRTARSGAVIGELALLTGGTRAASVRAQRDCHLWRVGRNEFEWLITSDQQFALALCRVLGAKLAEHRSPVTKRPPPRRIAIVALDAGVSSDDVASHLAAELSPEGQTSVLRRSEFPPDADHVAAVERAETLSRWVLLSAGAGPGDAWTDTCIAEADRVIAVSHGRPAREWIANAPLLLGCELLLVGRSVPDSVLQALEPAVVQALPDQTAVRRSLARGARRLSGRAVGIVFSGGGARAFAHLGVVQELRAYGVRIDRVGGVSMGALVAGAVAAEWDDETMVQRFRRYFVDQNPTGDYTLPAFSLIRGLRTRRLLAEAFGEMTIEGLPISFFCLSADLNSRAAVVHRTGPLRQAILSSLAVPGVFPPVPTSDGRLLVDGGVLDNLPVETMAADAEGPVIAVDVTRAAVWRPRAASGSSSRARARRMISGQDIALPRLGETLLQTLAVGSNDTVTAARRHADVVITPAVDGVGLLDWHRLGQMRDAGRQAVRHLLERDPAALRACL